MIVILIVIGVTVITTMNAGTTLLELIRVMVGSVFPGFPEGSLLAAIVHGTGAAMGATALLGLYVNRHSAGRMLDELGDRG